MRAEFLTFPEYTTAIGAEIGHALQGERDYAPDTLQLLYIANRFEFRPRISQWLDAGTMVVCDRYLASSIAYGEAQGVDAALADRDPAVPAATVADAAARHPAGRVAAPQEGGARQVRARPAVARPRARELPSPGGRRADWVRLDGHQDKDAVSAAVLSAVRSQLGLL